GLSVRSPDASCRLIAACWLCFSISAAAPVYVPPDMLKHNLRGFRRLIVGIDRLLASRIWPRPVVGAEIAPRKVDLLRGTATQQSPPAVIFQAVAPKEGSRPLAERPAVGTPQVHGIEMGHEQSARRKLRGRLSNRAQLIANIVQTVNAGYQVEAILT